jgi:RHS repeat-associated protein
MLSGVQAQEAVPDIPPDPSALAPDVNRSVATDIYESTRFLYTGANPVQLDAAAEMIGAACVAVLKGVVLGRESQPIAGVMISVLGHPEYGRTFSRADGAFDLVINGGGPVTLIYQKTGFLEIQRTVDAPRREFTFVDTVVLIALDQRATRIDLASNDAFQVARGSGQRDGDGDRQATLLFPKDSGAIMELPEGRRAALTGALTVRATEYTVGPTGLASMPGDLPLNSGYTYAVEFTIDEALAAGARDVQFAKPIVNYTENFIGAPVGSPVPTGYYDRGQARWLPSGNGRVIKVLRVADGVAEVDSTGDGAADNGVALGMTAAERGELARLYQAGQTLWRVEIPHFSPWDHNWPYGPPPGARAPRLNVAPNEVPNQCQTNGSIIGCENQTLGERLPVVGTPFSLNYSSDRVPGWRVAETLAIPVTGLDLPPGLRGVEVRVEVAGRQFSQRWSIDPQLGYPAVATNLTYRLEWDGRDGYGRLVQGRQVAIVRVRYVYEEVYYPANSDFDASFGQFPPNTELFNGRYCTDPFDCGVQLQQTVRRAIGPWDAAAAGGLGGWTLDIHHGYDPNEGSLYLGDGTTVRVDAVQPTVRTIAGGSSALPFPAAEGGPALGADLDYLGDIAIGADDGIYLYSGQNANHIRRISPDGRISTFAGNGQKGAPTCDGRPALQTVLGERVNALAAAPDGSLYFAATSPVEGADFICRISPGGSVTKLAGNGIRPQNLEEMGDGGPAVDAALSYVSDLIFGPDGSLYLAQRWAPGNRARVRKIDPNGVIVTIAGGSGNVNTPDIPTAPTPATTINLPPPDALVFSGDGGLYVAVQAPCYVARIAMDGTISRFAGNGACVPYGDGQPATSDLASVGRPVNLAVGRDGIVYIRATGGSPSSTVIRKVEADGILTTQVGRLAPLGAASRCPGRQVENEAAREACIQDQSRGLEITPDGALIYGDGPTRLRRVGLLLRDFAADTVVVPSPDGAEVFQFSGDGQHLRTLDGLTGALRYSFVYDAARRLTAVVDAFGNITSIERSTSGEPTAIVAPGGQRTSLVVGAQGFLAAIANPASETTSLTYGAGGLLATLSEPRGGIHTFGYDSQGRLVRDESPDGAVKTLSRVETTDSVSVTVRTALGRETLYTSELLSTGDRLRRVREPSGAVTTRIIGADGLERISTPDGSTITLTSGGDSRWGSRVPRVKSMLILTPGGRRSEIAVDQSAELATPGDPLSLQKLTETVNVNGNIWKAAYDAATRTTTFTSPTGRRTVESLDAQGRLISWQVGDLLPTTLTYNSVGQLAALTEGSGVDARVSSLSYTSRRELERVTDPLGRVVSFAYDAAGRPAQQALPDGRTTAFAYDAGGNLTVLTPPDRPAHDFTYTPGNQLATYTPPTVGPGGPTQYTYDGDQHITRVTRSGGQTMELTYDSAGRLTTLALARGQMSLAYDANTDQLSLIGAPGGIDLAFSYDGLLPTQESWSGPVGGSVAHSYNNDLRVATHSVNGGSAVAYNYDKDGLLTAAGGLSLSYNQLSGLLSGGTLGGVSDSWSYNGFAEPTSYSASYDDAPIFSVSYTRDALGRIVTRAETIGGATATYGYSYDLRGRLVGVTRDGAAVAGYSYDANGNRLSAAGDGLTVTAAYDAQDRLLSYGGTTYSYNPSGDLLGKTTGGQPTTYTYDERGSLISVALPGGKQLDYLVDGRGRRVGKQVGGALVQGFLYQDELRPAAELDGSGAIVSRFVYASRPNLPEYMVKGDVTYRIIADHLGSPRLVVNTATGAIAQQMHYDAFGRVTLDSNPGFQPFGFAGGLYDRDTGLVRFGARDYDPETGRWTAKDPIGFAGGDANLYAYIQSDPVNNIDPLGLAGIYVGGQLGGSLGAGGEVGLGTYVGSEGIYGFHSVGGGFSAGATGLGPSASVAYIWDLKNFSEHGTEVGITLLACTVSFYMSSSSGQDWFGGSLIGVGISGPTPGAAVNAYKTYTWNDGGISFSDVIQGLERGIRQLYGLP